PLFKEAGETGVVEVKIKNEVLPALIHNVQKDPKTGRATHVDFQKVNLKEKIITHVPIKLVGESPAEKAGAGLLLQTINELEIESLPTDIPSQIEVEATKLEEVGQNVQVKDLKIDRDRIEVKNNPEDVIVSVQTAEMKEEPVEEEAPSPEEVEATAEKGEEEVAEGEEKPAEEKREESKGEQPSGESSEKKEQ
ncbi:hypothetical protein KA005_71875, partial [bacterium]|nr:hypothetical protein [bacterium]